MSSDTALREADAAILTVAASLARTDRDASVKLVEAMLTYRRELDRLHEIADRPTPRAGMPTTIVPENPVGDQPRAPRPPRPRPAVPAPTDGTAQ